MNELFLIYATALFVYLVVMYLVINIATKADKRARYEWGQLQLLAEIARAQGVQESAIQEIFKVVDKK